MTFYIKKGLSFDMLAVEYALDLRESIHKYYEDIKSVPVDRSICIIGSIEDTRYYLKQLGIHIKEDMSLPDQIEPLVKRFIKKTDKITIPHTGRYFVKKADGYKILEPFIGKYKEGDIVGLGAPFIFSEEVEFISEYRVFVYNGVIVGIKHYLGDCTIFPDIDFIKLLIKNYTNAPIAYTLDVGINEKGVTDFIECNDMWAVGSYGLEPSIFTRMLIDRWVEILTKNNN